MKIWVCVGKFFYLCEVESFVVEEYVIVKVIVFYNNVVFGYVFSYSEEL